MVNLCEVFYARSSPPTGVVFGLKRAFRLISNTCTQGGGGALVRVVGPRQGGGGALIRVVGPRQGGGGALVRVVGPRQGGGEL